MGLLTRTATKMLTMEDPSQPLLPESLMREFFGIGRSDAGVVVNVEGARRLTTVFGCQKVISEDGSSLPLYIYKRGKNETVSIDRKHRLWNLVCVKPNPFMDSVSFRAAMLVNVLGWGNAYAWIQRDNSNRPVALRILPSNRTAPKLKDQDGVTVLVYETTATVDGTRRFLDASDVIHLKGLSENGIVGLSPIQVCKNAFGLAIAAEKFGAQLFGNGARASGVLEHPGGLSDEAYANLKKSLLDRLNGENALSPLILEEGMTWKQLSISPDDAQFIATRKFQRSEIAALFRVPMHLLQDLERATNNNIEHQSLDYIRYTLKPWLVKLEQEMFAKLFTSPIDADYFLEHDLNDFQRGDWTSLTTGLNTLRNAGTLTTNEVRRKVGMNPLNPEQGGDLILVPLNTMAIERAMQGDPKQLPAPPDKDGTIVDPDAAPPAQRVAKFRKSMVPAMRDALGRLSVRKEWDQAFAGRTLSAPCEAIMQGVVEDAGVSIDRIENHFSLESAIEVACIYAKSCDAKDARMISEIIFEKCSEALNLTEAA
jgi:HK97 family phage portal protein